MNKLQVFNNNEFGEIRTVNINDEPWFVTMDVCRSLDIKNATDVVKRLDEDEVTRFNLGGLSGEVNCVNEFGLYSLVLGSRKPEARQFKRWITHEVIPQIRKTGSYMPDASALSPELALMNALVSQMNQEALSRQKLQSQIEQTTDRLEETKEELQDIRDVIEITPFDNWREDTNKLINKISMKTGDYKDTRSKIYEALDRRAGTKIKQRLENMKARVLLAGSSKSKADALTYLDVIAEDKKLIEIYIAIAKEMAIKKGVN